MQYEAFVTVQVAIKFDPPDPDVPNEVTDDMSEEDADAVGEVRTNVAKHAEEMVPGVLHGALDEIGEIRDIMIGEVTGVDA